MLARRLFAAREADVMLAVDLPQARAMMHLDTVFTMVDVATFVAYPNLDLDRCCAPWKLTPGDDEAEPLHVETVTSLSSALAVALEVDHVHILRAGDNPRAVEREQWSDGNNYVALEPGVVIGYDRNVVTNALLEAHGVEVLAVSGGELGRGRGGARCMDVPRRPRSTLTRDRRVSGAGGAPCARQRTTAVARRRGAPTTARGAPRPAAESRPESSSPARASRSRRASGPASSSTTRPRRISRAREVAQLAEGLGEEDQSLAREPQPRSSSGSSNTNTAGRARSACRAGSLTPSDSAVTQTEAPVSPHPFGRAGRRTGPDRGPDR